MPRKQTAYFYKRSIKSELWGGFEFSHIPLPEYRERVLRDLLNNVRSAETDDEALKMLENFGLGIIEDIKPELDELRLMVNKTHKDRATGGKATAKNRHVSEAYKQAQAMWFDWFVVGNKQAYTHRGKTNKTALAYAIIERLQERPNNGVAYDFSEMSHAHLMQKFRDWEAEHNEQMQWQSWREAISKDIPPES